MRIGKRTMRELNLATAAIVTILTSLAAQPAIADGKDCPFVGMLDNFAPQGDTEWVAYDTRTFGVWDGKQYLHVDATGKVCHQIYRLKPGSDKMSGLEIMANYEQALPAEGAEITNTNRDSDADMYGKITKDGAEYWLYVYQSNGDSVTVTTVQKMPFNRTITAPSGVDYPLLGHLPGTQPRAPVKVHYDEVKFPVTQGTETKGVAVRGYHYKISYDVYHIKPLISGLEIQENYRAALKDLNAEILYTKEGEETVARVDNNGKTVWIDVTGGTGATITVDTIEEKPFLLSIKPPQAADMKATLDHTDRITLYVNFAFNKAILQPDAQPIIAQVATLMKSNPDLKFSVEGHTDSIGLHDYNVKLSQDRAAAVVAALEAQSIAASRLSSTGFGPDKPIAPNETDPGRAKNRRVELVKK
jgi:outer membrane protein OmpA-like peptidoglycan-associated protein